MTNTVEPKSPIYTDPIDYYEVFRDEALDKLGSVALHASIDTESELQTPEEQERLLQDVRAELELDTEAKIYMALAERMTDRMDLYEGGLHGQRYEAKVNMMYAYAAILEFDKAEEIQAELKAIDVAHYMRGFPEPEDRFRIDFPDTVKTILIAEASGWATKEKVAKEQITAVTAKRVLKIREFLKPDSKVVQTVEDQTKKLEQMLETQHEWRAEQIQEGSEAYSMLQDFIEKGPEGVKLAYAKLAERRAEERRDPTSVRSPRDARSRSNFVRALSEFAVGRHKQMLHEIGSK